MREDVKNIQIKFDSDFCDENFALYEIKKDKYYNFEAIDPDSYKTDLFCSVVNRAIELFAEDNVIMYCSEYKRKSEKRGKRLIFPGKSATFRKDGEVSKLKSEFEEKGISNGFFSDVLKEEGKKTHKYLCVLKEVFDMDFLQKTDVSYKDEGTTGVNVIIFPHKNIIQMGSDEETVKKYFYSEDFIIKICSERLLARAYIKINPNFISEERVEDVLKTAVVQNGKQFFFLNGGSDWIGFDW